MSEEKAIKSTPGLPVTVGSLQRDLSRLGVSPGMVLLVHTSLSSLGWVCGGPAAVILALEGLLGPEGTLVMPAHTGDLSEPSQWVNPPVPESWWPVIRAESPAFDPALTTTRCMGAVAEAFRAQPGTLRSSHPHVSFAARGPYAKRITAGHSLSNSLGEVSPLARLYELDGRVLLLGVGYGNNTSLHLAEYRAQFKGKRRERQGAPLLVDGVRRWVEFDDLSLDDEDFPTLGAAFEQERPGEVQVGQVGQATARLMSQRALVDFAEGWMTKNRKEQP